jgi:hypothetical protein
METDRNRPSAQRGTRSTANICQGQCAVARNPNSIGLSRSALEGHTSSNVVRSNPRLRPVYGEDEPPLPTVLIPCYVKEARVVRRSLVSAALQEYPRRQVVLLIDDPPVPGNDHDAARLAAARALLKSVARIHLLPFTASWRSGSS